VHAGEGFGIVYIPDFVAIGNIVEGFRRPSFLLIGSDDEVGTARAVSLYRRILAPDNPVRTLSIHDAELTKLARNVFLCLKISFGNFPAQLGEQIGGVDLDRIADTLTLEPRIGVGLLRGGSPYGGPCLPRDIGAMLHLAGSLHLEAPLIQAIDRGNTLQCDLIEEAVLANNPHVAVLGLSFKPGTPVTTASLGFELIARLERRHVQIHAYDPMQLCRLQARAALFWKSITWHDELQEALKNADTIVICNPDPHFAQVTDDIPQRPLCYRSVGLHKSTSPAPRASRTPLTFK
jgi:UDPglucose 6-dehydrogenase